MPRTVAEFLPLKKAAEVAGLDRRQLRQMAERGLIQTSTLPGSVRRHRLYRRSDLEQLRKAIEQGFHFAGRPPIPAAPSAPMPRPRPRSRLVA